MTVTTTFYMKTGCTKTRAEVRQVKDPAKYFSIKLVYPTFNHCTSTTLCSLYHLAAHFTVQPGQ